ncbi:MAG: ribosome silencing factor [Clostridia bacterium]|nr:ribosome silencing factor [Clostridia bacterium]MBR3808919.1 ribosome silencing factor [Clostridia bacterium]
MSLELTKKIVKVLDDKLARDIEVIKTEEVTIVADYFVIATANSNTHVRALADEIEYQLEQEDIRPDHIEGRATGWVLMQYGGVVVHIFLEDSRQYYNLERLWDDASKIDISQFID